MGVRGCACGWVQLKRIPPHCLEGLRSVYFQLEVFICSKSLNTLEVSISNISKQIITCIFGFLQFTLCVLQELLLLCGGDLSTALPWLELHTLNFSYNSISSLDESLVRHNIYCLIVDVAFS